MKAIKTLLLAFSGVIVMGSCMSDEGSYQAGFPVLQTKYAYRYANSFGDSLYVASYGNWKIESTQAGNEWCQLERMSGVGYANYGFPMNISENTTGNARSAAFKIYDTDHPNDAYSNFNITQLATRGDGSLGNAALVHSVTGSDNSRIEAAYDKYSRPISLRIAKGDVTLHNLKFVYDDAAHTMFVSDSGQKGTGPELTATYSNDFQPYVRLVSAVDTIKFVEQSEFNMIGNRYAFNIEHRKASGSYDAYAYLVKDISLLRPDNLHNADSLKYISGTRSGITEKLSMELTYSDYDNRCQSLDVNQLLLGIDRCNPYMLLSLFRTARNTSIFNEVKAGNEIIKFETELNADKSVRKLTVVQGQQKVTYDFEY